MTKIQLRHDTKANFEQVNPVLLVGEAAVETDTGKFKLGNGTDNYTTLPYTYAIPNLELPLEYKAKTETYEAYGNVKTQVPNKNNYYYDMAGINSPSGFSGGFEFNFKVKITGNIAGTKKVYIYQPVTDNGISYAFYLAYQSDPSTGYMFFKLGPSSQAETRISVPGYSTIRNPQYFRFYFNPITKKAGIEVYRYKDYSERISYGEFNITDAQLKVWNNHIKNVTNLNVTIENYSSSSSDQTYDCQGATAIPATVTTVYNEDTLIVNKATNTTPGIVQPDNETIGIENGLLTVIDGDPGGTLRTQLNGIQTQVTGLETNKVNIDADNLSTTGKANITNLSFPSTRYVDLTLGASGDTYTAPADGWFFMDAVPGAAGQYIEYLVGSPLYYKYEYSTNTQPIQFLAPVKKGEIVTVNYTTNSGLNKFIFIYAEGN